jgi:hypothetical protein
MQKVNAHNLNVGILLMTRCSPFVQRFIRNHFRKPGGEPVQPDNIHDCNVNLDLWHQFQVYFWTMLLDMYEPQLESACIRYGSI